MIGLIGSPSRTCEGLTRREWLRVGGLTSAVGLGLPDLLHSRGKNLAQSRAKSCIVVFLFGAPAHQDIWDLKPQCRTEYRSEFKPIASSVTGIQVGEHIPRLASIAHKYSIVRSVTHPDNTHTVAMHYMLTGTRHARPQTNPQNSQSDFPCFGAAVRYLRPGHPLPAGISLNAPANQVSANNHIFPGFFAGIIGRKYDPMFVSDDPNAPNFSPFPTADGRAAVELGDRRDLSVTLEGSSRATRSRAEREFDHFQGQALDLVTSPVARQAFDLNRESQQVRNRYGRNSFGQGLLLARRLVEANVPLVTVNWARNDAYWDTHSDNFNLHKKTLLPPFDLGFSALIEDLSQRGLLDETLVYCLGEFGRTPKINGSAGRDHWAACNSVILAGGGVKGGQVYGSSDKNAAYPSEKPVQPEDLSATIYDSLGIKLDTELHDPLGKPVPLTTGKPLRELFV